ncbi:MAG: bifunctional [glutamine synthetase] adenylyltransferase/[glutamine synthetase]-adenylyl-L-tyrosine phosphorylase [Acidisphaera sp.]|nr:bifunctional [glutamine synthetase] adenylyltransferase/[glutamine synthetase]-adenylyl-L-tyrosine phosphorylase [Acidisphaera sp.]
MPQDPPNWPRPADPAAAARLVERLAERGPADARLAGQPRMAPLLAAIGGNSPYLAELALREPAVLRRFWRDGPAAVVERVLAEIAGTLPATPRPRIAALLRQAKRRVALATALADIGGLWTLEQVTAALSDLADAALRLAVAHLLLAAHENGELRLPDPARPDEGSGFTVLGMGKLGARELNYSSDVDLVLLYEPAAQASAGEGAVSKLGAHFTRIARGLVALMEARDGDGYVFRTDLRLRPDPPATPPAVAMPGAIAYYESMGQNWERAAMLKARPVAGDLALGAAFLAAIRPFIWRRHLDFSAIADIHAMKRRIDAHKGSDAMGADPVGADPVAAIAGHDVKLGRGGIREIEFLAQTLSLVWGGRDPGLREPTTLGALRLLARAGHLPKRAAGELAAAYRFLRRLEHRLQMVADRQTHRLPDKPAEVERFAVFFGYVDGTALATALLRHLGRVKARYAALFEANQPAVGAAAALDFRGAHDRPETLAVLTRLGFANTQAIVAAVRGWQAGRARALRSHRARELLIEVLPGLLAALSCQAQPDVAFARFDAFLARLPAGVQLLSLFQRNPTLLDRVAAVLGAAPSLADHLARVPAALEGLLHPEAPPPPAQLLRRRLGDAALLEEAIAALRAAVQEEDFRISVATMEGRLHADAAGLARAALADAALTALLPRVLADHAGRYGRVRGGGMAVVALGKAGGREMMAGSDLDLMLIYDHPPQVSESDGPRGIRALPASQWYIRAAHAFVAALTAPGPEGPLYAVDMRLRPSGNKGPVAVPLAGFRRYHRESAWTWERMALTRARVIAGPPALRARVATAIAAAIGEAGEAGRIRADAAAMRARLARDLPPAGPWDVKHRAGGLVEVEFIAQTLQLMHARAHPQIASPTTRVALHRLAAAGLLDRDDAALLVQADRTWRSVQEMLRITVGRHAEATLPAPSAQALLRAVAPNGAPNGGPDGGIDLDGLRARLDALAGQVRACFERIVGAPEPALLGGTI